MRCVSVCKYGGTALRWRSSWRAECLAKTDESETKIEGTGNRKFGGGERTCRGTMKEKYERTC